MKKLIRFSLLVPAFLLFFNQVSIAKRSFHTYKSLQMKDLEEMQKIVKFHTDRATAISIERNKDNQNFVDNPGDGEAIEHLRRALLIVFSRPNKENMISDILPPLASKLRGYNSYQDSLVSLTNEAIRGIKNKKFKADKRGTYLFVLENLMKENIPELGSEEDVKDLFIRIRDAKIKVDKKVLSDRRLGSMFSSFNPSESARLALEKKFPEEKKKSSWWPF